MKFKEYFQSLSDHGRQVRLLRYVAATMASILAIGWSPVLFAAGFGDMWAVLSSLLIYAIILGVIWYLAPTGRYIWLGTVMILSVLMILWFTFGLEKTGTWI
jgi:hypothetical protein